MTLSKFLRPLFAMIALAGLAGCGGGGGTQGGMPAPPEQDTRTTGQLFLSGETLTARHAAGVRVNHDEETTEGDEYDVSIRRTAEGGFVYTVGDVSHTFTAGQFVADKRRFESESDGKVVHKLDLWTSDFEGLTGQDDYFELFESRWFTGRGPLEELRGFSVTGNPTADFNAMGNGTVTYRGRAVFDFYLANGYTSSGEGLMRFRGDATLTADFGNATVSGRLDGFDNDAEDFVATMPETRFTDKGFAGDLQTSGLDRDERLTVSYEGSFFGPSASQVAGTFSGTYVEEGITSNVVGWFGTDRDG